MQSACQAQGACGAQVFTGCCLKIRVGALWQCTQELCLLREESDAVELRPKAAVRESHRGLAPQLLSCVRYGFAVFPFGFCHEGGYNVGLVSLWPPPGGRRAETHGHSKQLCTSGDRLGGITLYARSPTFSHMHSRKIVFSQRVPMLCSITSMSLDELY